jgi:hypothetical protein
VRVNLLGFYWGKGNLYGKRGEFLHVDFWVARDELSVRKSTSHVVLDRHPLLGCVYAGNVACVPVKMGCVPMWSFSY